MSKDPFTSVEFRVDGEVVEGIEHSVVPEIGSTVELGGTFDDDGERMDPNLVDFHDFREGTYETVLEGEVVDVTYHYGRGHARSECTVYVDVEVFDE